MRVLVAHPGLQHSHQLAAALEEAGLLAGFWSGLPVTDSRAAQPEFWAKVRPSTPAVPVPARLRRHAVMFPLARRTATTLLPPDAANSACHRLEGAFDRLIAKRIDILQPDLVVCYENAALETFRAARAIGAVCVLDAASVHYASARSWGGTSVRGNPAWIDHRKQQEIELADAILTCSDLAARSYRAAGISAATLYPVPLGAELPVHVGHAPPSGSHCRFVFAGTIRRLKGVDLLLDVFAAFERENVAARLTLIGSAVEPDLARRAGSMSNVTCLPFMPQARLLEVIARHDCLVLPSRFDAFGMVVPEAMAVGVPALVSDRVGAKCIVEHHPDAGWIVGCDVAALKTQLHWLIDHRAALAQASDAALAAAQDYTWLRYRQRAVAALLDIHCRYAKPAR